MFRVRCVASPVTAFTAPDAEGHASGARRSGLRLAALTGLGLALGAGGATLTISLVQAGDDAGIRAFHLQEAANRRALREATQPTYAYAPAPRAQRSWAMPLYRSRADGTLPQPRIELNPFRRTRQPARSIETTEARPRRVAMRYDTVSGAASSARTICVRMCDGYHSPLGHLRSMADLSAHEALCQAANPGVPVKVFRVPAGAATIDGAVSREGKTYGSLPMAYAYQSSADPACRPAMATASGYRSLLLRDVTLRAGDSIVLDGRVRTYHGAAGRPRDMADFGDFRASRQLTAAQRTAIDSKVGVSQREAELRSFKRGMRVREAVLADAPVLVASDAIVLRGGIDPRGRTGEPRRIVLDSPSAIR